MGTDREPSIFYNIFGRTIMPNTHYLIMYMEHNIPDFSQIYFYNHDQQILSDVLNVLSYETDA